MFNNINMEDINKMMGQFQEMSQNSPLGKSDQIFEAKSGGGLVAISVKGNFEIVDIQIDDSLMEDKDSLQILLMSAFNEAIKMALADKSTALTDMMQNFMSPTPPNSTQ